MRVFITGASGFIGRNLIKLLSQDSNKLLLLAKNKKDYELLPPKYKQNAIIGNLKNIAGFKKDISDFHPQVCVHLAWEGIPDFSFDMCRRNLEDSSRLVDFIANETECRKIIISGTCAEYGKRKGTCKESDKAKINSFLSWAKHSLYHYANLMCKKANKDLIWFRIFYIYGSGQRKESLIPSLVSSFKGGLKPNINNPLNANDFVHISDVAEAFKSAVHKNIDSGIYNLGSGKPTKVIDICKIAEKIICGTTSRSKEINLNSNCAETVNFWADINKTQRSMSWEPDISLKKGIENHLKQELTQ